LFAIKNLLVNSSATSALQGFYPTIGDVANGQLGQACGLSTGTNNGNDVVLRKFITDFITPKPVLAAESIVWNGCEVHTRSP
jgi:hypothetical protein